MNQQEIAFFGRISAGLSHEIKNVLAIIKESSGLMEDILGLAKENSIPHQDRLFTACANIKKQIDRGVDLTTELNRLSHSMDYPSAEVDLNDMLNQITLLMQRFARAKKITLSSLPGDSSLSLRTDPFRLQMLLGAAIDYCLEKAPQGGFLILHPARHQQALGVQIAFNDQNTSLPPLVLSGTGRPDSLNRLAEVLDHLKADIQETGSAENPGLWLSFQGIN